MQPTTICVRRESRTAGVSVVLDTGDTWIWFLHGDRKLGRKSRDAIETALTGPGAVIPAIVLDVAMLATRGRVTLQRDVLDWLDYHAGLPGFVIQPLSAAIATDSCRLPGTLHNDPADRLIVATARHHCKTVHFHDRQLVSRIKTQRADAFPGFFFEADGRACLLRLLINSLSVLSAEGSNTGTAICCCAPRLVEISYLVAP